MKFTVIDFETANSKRASACALGIASVEDGLVTNSQAWLIRPKELRFSGMNIAIHGIRAADVAHEPEFDVLYEQVFKPMLEGQLVVAHNASFDMSVLRHTLDLYGLPYPTFDYLCTVKIAQKTWPDLHNHKLNTLSDMLSFQFKHHDALDDSLACANVLVQACKRHGVQNPVELAKLLNIQVGKLYAGGYKACSVRRK